MTSYMFQLTVAPGAHNRLRQLNEEYGPLLAKVAAGIEGLSRIEKWLLGDTYVERIDFDGEFADFARQFSADKEVRQFLRGVDGCFAESLKEMTDRAMSCLQALPGSPDLTRPAVPAGRTAGPGSADDEERKT